MFACVLRLDGEPVSDVSLLAGTAVPQTGKVQEAGASRGLGPFRAMISLGESPIRPLFAQRRNLVGVGNVRLDDRDATEARCPSSVGRLTDLELVLEVIACRGVRCIPDLLGDFAFVVWDSDTRQLVAARDPFGVKSLFYSVDGQLLRFSSHLSNVADTRAHDHEFIADFLLGGDLKSSRTIWANASLVPAGSMVTVQDGSIGVRRFWSPDSWEPRSGETDRQACEQLGELLCKAVEQRVSKDGATWAELSGGTDSSSVVCLAQIMLECGRLPAGVSGTVTIVDELGAGDERRYSDLVVQRFRLPNELVLNHWAWQDDGCGPPLTDEPRSHYPFFARDRRLYGVVQEHGGRVLLSGYGSDNYLAGNRNFIADWITQGRLGEAIRLLAQWSIAERKSFWSALREDALYPFLPLRAKLRFARPEHALPPWIDRKFARRFHAGERLPRIRGLSAPPGKRFAKQIIDGILEIPKWIPRGTFEESLELRYPFLYRPLVEHGLQLPAQARERPLASKWALRQAMTGVLPEAIRTRQGKGGIDARIIWSLSRERARIDDLLRAPLLAELGCIDRVALTSAVSDACNGRSANSLALLRVLSLETWLEVRSGRWSTRGNNQGNSSIYSFQDDLPV